MTPNQKAIDNYLMHVLGLELENRYYYANDYIAITDVSAEREIMCCLMGIHFILSFLLSCLNNLQFLF